MANMILVVAKIAIDYLKDNMENTKKQATLRDLFDIPTEIGRPKVFNDPLLSQQAKNIITKFGGVRALHYALTSVGFEINKATIHKWQYSKTAGGTGGLIPTINWPYILKAARNYGVLITTDDLDSDWTKRPEPKRLKRKYLKMNRVKRK